MGKLLLVACTNVGRYIIETIKGKKDNDIELVGVINLNRKQGINKANYDDYSDLAIKYNLPIFYCENINDDEAVKFMRSKNPDIILQSGWSQKFSDEVLNIPKFGCIGEHPAPLPKGRGAACVNWAILTGETEWGDSYFKMVQEYDKGDLYAQRRFKIEPYDTVFTIYEKVAQCAVEVISEYASKWCRGEFDVIKQNEAEVTYYKRRKPTDGQICSFNEEPIVLHNFIRAQTFPYPGAYIETQNGKLYLLESKVIESFKTSLPSGTVFGDSACGGVYVSTCDGNVLELIRVKMENSPSMWAKDFFTAYSLPKCIFDI
ncbi:MAG: methionyl-tRNA formyltransferase [Ruminococcaceae bacterium]|nr:methionyl-tRNA formyltransferase [Oscillospiraceae bacterium]